jgi:hypothetical protein
MKTNTILLVALGGVIIYFITRNKTQAQSNTSNQGGDDKTPINPTPTPTNTTSNATPIAGRYKVKEAFAGRFAISPSATSGFSFKVGDLIEASPNPYANGKLYTTPKGDMPNYSSIGQKWIEVPLDKVELVLKESEMREEKPKKDFNRGLPLPPPKSQADCGEGFIFTVPPPPPCLPNRPCPRSMPYCRDLREFAHGLPPDRIIKPTKMPRVITTDGLLSRIPTGIN